MRSATALLLALWCSAAAPAWASAARSNPAVHFTETRRAADLIQASPADTIPENEYLSAYERRMGWFSRDKAYHFSISAVGAGGVYAISRDLGLSRTQSAVLSAIILGTAGVWREVGTTDRGNLFTRAHLSRRDLVWDGLGIAAGISLADLLLERRRGPGEVVEVAPRPAGPEE